MKPFDYVRADSIADASAQLGGDRLALAGGTDLIPLLKDGLCSPGALIDIKHAGLPTGIRVDDETMFIGALTTLAEIERSDEMRRILPLLCEAASVSATRQLRNRATIGGNLLQESRCWYYRHPDLRCWLRGGDQCFAKDGRNERHALTSRNPCVTVHPSDLAGCLLALDASVHLQSASGSRDLALNDFLVVPSDAHRALHLLAEQELVTGISIPVPAIGVRSTYLKAMSRKAWSFALVGVAAVLTVENEGIVKASVVLNGVAPKPWRLANPATATSPLSATALADSLGEQFERDAAPLAHNGYKVGLARALLAQAIDELMSPA